MRPGRLVFYVGVSIAATSILWVVFEAAGHGVALAVAITALVVLVASYVYAGVLIVRAMSDERASERPRLQRTGAVIPVMFGIPLIVLAAHPWGPASAIVGTGAVVVCQFVLTWVITVAFLIRARRARPTPPR